jgi:hypothetical protein
MKKIKCVQCALIACLSVLVVSCSTPSTGTAVRQQRFHDGSSVSVVLHFYRWDSIYMTRPDTRQAGFLPLFNREQVARELRHRALKRGLAVVAVSSNYTPDQIPGISRDWRKLLAEQGFQRVVILRAGATKEIDGLIILEDSGISAADDTQWKFNDAVAARPSAAGADVAYSPGGSIR